MLGSGIREQPVSIFKEMHPYRPFGCYEAYDNLQRMLGEAIERGYVEEVSVMKRHPMRSAETWYREKETGDIYCLNPPDFPACGSWEQVDIEDLKRSDYPVQ